MKTSHIAFLTAFAAVLAALSPASGQQDRSARSSSGPLGTMPHGSYSCSLPGDASGPAFVPIEAEDFDIIPASRYVTKDGRGTYILRGRELTFTRGPKKGERYDRVGDNQLRKLSESGRATELLCTRTG